jgi:hypothetical protein
MPSPPRPASSKPNFSKISETPARLHEMDSVRDTARAGRSKGSVHQPALPRASILRHIWRRSLAIGRLWNVEFDADISSGHCCMGSQFDFDFGEISKWDGSGSLECRERWMLRVTRAFPVLIETEPGSGFLL